MKSSFANIALLWLLFSTLVVEAENQLIDSLLVRFSQTKEDTSRIKILNDISWQYKSSDLDKSFAYCDSAARYSKRINYVQGIAKGFILRGVYNTIAGRFDSAVVEYRKCMALRNSLADSTGVAACLHDIGTVHLYSGNPDSALHYFLLSLRIEEKFGSNKNIAEGYLNVGDVYMEMENYDKALEYFMKYTSRINNPKDGEGICEAYNNIGQVYHFKKKYDQATAYFMKGLTTARLKGNIDAESASLAGLGQIDLAMNRPEAALVKLNQSLELIRQLGRPDAEASVLLGLGEACHATHAEAKAEAYVLEGLNIAKEIGAKRYVRNSYELLSLIYSAQNNFKKAYDMHVLFMAYQDSIVNERTNKAIAELQTRFDVDKKEAENKMLHQENTIKDLQLEKSSRDKLMLTIFIVLLFVGAMLFIWFRRIKEEKRIQLLRIQEREERTRNVLQAEEQERLRIARELHDGVGQLLSAAKMNLSRFESNASALTNDQRTGLHTGIELVDDSVREIRTISHNLMPSALSKSGLKDALSDLVKRLQSDKLQVRLEVVGLDQRLALSVESVIYRLIQELISNVLKHSKATEVDLQVVKHDDELVVMMEDNGIGFDPSKESEGIGLKNMRSRIGLLNGTINFDSRPGRGTIVTVELPVKTI